jgi:hypothetical protein
MRSSLFLEITQRKLVVTDVSGQGIGPIYKGQAVQEDLYCLAFEDATYSLSRNVGNYKSTLHNIPEEGISAHYLLCASL